MKQAIVLLSGGQDSTTALFWAMQKFNVMALSFNYGQRHYIELECACKIASLAKVHHSVTEVYLDHVFSSLTSDLDINAPHPQNENLPSTFVPGRNLHFILTAATIAYSAGIQDIVLGVCQTDYSGYPDCRDQTIKSINVSLNLAMDYQFIIHTPLMWMTKKETVLLAKELPGCMEALAFSHTCYEGEHPPCGECPACKLRAKGFKEASILDPIHGERKWTNNE